MKMPPKALPKSIRSIRLDYDLNKRLPRLIRLHRLPETPSEFIRVAVRERVKRLEKAAAHD